MTLTDQRVQASPKRHGIRALVTAAAVLAAVVVYLAVVEAGGYEVRVPEEPGSRTLVPLELGAVVGAAVIACVAGWVFLTVLELLTAKAPAIWTGTAVVVYLLTLPYMPGFRIGDRLMLIVMHSALAAVLILGFRRTMRRSS